MFALFFLAIGIGNHSAGRGFLFGLMIDIGLARAFLS